MKGAASSTWPTKPLGELCRIELGSTPARNNALLWDDKWQTDNVWLSIADLPQTLHGVAVDSKEYVSDLATHRMRLIPKGSLLVSFKLTLGRLAYAGRSLFSNEAIASLLEIDEEVISKPFLYWALTAFDWDKAAEGDQKIKGKTLNKKKLKLIPIPLPPLKEQQLIVATLDETFEAIASAQAHAEANLRNARELFENSLIATFSQVIHHSKHMTLAEASISFGRGRSRHRPRNAAFLYGGPYPFIQTGDVRNSDGTVSTFSQSYSEEGLAQSKLWPAGTICITIAANIAETAVLGFDACFPDSIIGMLADPESTFPEYVEFMLRYFAADLKKQGKGSAQDNINLGTFECAQFPFPSLSEQREIVERLSRLANETSLLSEGYSQKLQDLDDLRQSLLQKAFAGELT